MLSAIVFQCSISLAQGLPNSNMYNKSHFSDMKKECKSDYV